MTNVFQDIFGGSTSTSTSTPVNMNPLTAALAPGVTGAFNAAIGRGVPQYNGPLTVGTTPTQNTLMDQITQMVNPGNPVSSYTNMALGGGLLPGGANFNPFVQAQIQGAITPIQEQLATATGQTLPAQFTAGGQQLQGSRLNNSGAAPGSTAFTNAEALANQSAFNAEATAAANIESNAYNTGVQATTAAAGISQQEVQTTINALQANLLPTLLQQQGITNGLQAFQENVQALVTFLGTLSGAISPVIGNTATSTSTSTPGIIPDIAALAAGLKPTAPIPVKQV